MPVAVRRVEALEKIHLPVPAVGEFVVLGVFPAPFQPVLVTGEEFFLTGKQIDAERRSHRCCLFAAYGLGCFRSPPFPVSPVWLELSVAVRAASSILL